MAAWKLTVRHGAEVTREEFEQLDDAIAELGRRAGEIRAEGPLEAVSAFRDFEPAERVAARIEISGRRLLRAPTAGVDVRGDGSLVPFRGAVRREEIEPERGEDAIDAVRSALRG